MNTQVARIYSQIYYLNTPIALYRDYFDYKIGNDNLHIDYLNTPTECIEHNCNVALQALFSLQNR